MDDDVQYIGTRLPFAEPIPCGATGITLHVDKCGDKPAHDLTFYHTSTGHVNIGRKSSSDDRSMRRENDDRNAVFTCQVVSAKHAKLILSDCGQVCVVDLHSRHGTHLLRHGETSPRMLPPEVETLLVDGDVLTFGKVVGAGSYHVSPVTVRVELLTCDPPSEPPAHRTLTPSLTPPPLPAPPRPRKLSSGRYGLLSASCLESDSSHSSSSVSSSPVGSFPSEDSEVEDEPPCVPIAPGKTFVKIPTFRSFIRDIYHSPSSHEPIVLDLSDDPLEDASAAPPSADQAARPPSPVPVVVSESFSKSRSHSPMEVATPSPSPPPEAQPLEPAVIGAWPASRPESPRHPSLEVEIGRSEVPPPSDLDHEPELVRLLSPPTSCQARIPPLSNDAFLELMHRLPPPPPFFPIGGTFSSSIASDFGLPSIPPPPPPPPPHFPPSRRIPPIQPIHKMVTERVNSEIKGHLKTVEDRMTTMQDSVDNVVLRQNGTEDDVADLQSRIEMLEPDAESLLCRVAGTERNIASLSTLQGQVTALRDEVTTLRERLDAPKPAEPPADDFKACANALSILVTEMKALREDVDKRIEVELEVVRSARVEALDALKAVVTEAESVRSSKRKRQDDEAEEEAPDTMEAPLDVAMAPATQEVDDVPSLDVSECTAAQVPVPMPVPEMCVSEVTASEPPRKRARTAVYTAARTAAAMAIGAAATWSALAFS